MTAATPISAAVKVALNWILTAIPWLGIMGAAWATAADMGVAAVINLYFIRRYIGYRMELLQLFKTMAAAAVMAGAVYLFYSFVMRTLAVNAVATFGSVLIGVVVYIAALILVRGLREEDMARIPFIGSFSIRFLRRMGIFHGVEEAKG